jgi:hypothetical protein
MKLTGMKQMSFKAPGSFYLQTKHTDSIMPRTVFIDIWPAFSVKWFFSNRNSVEVKLPGLYMHSSIIVYVYTFSRELGLNSTGSTI